MFEKSIELFPIKNNYIFLTHCSVSPLYSKAFKRELEISQGHQNRGGLYFADYNNILNELHTVSAELLKTSKENLAFVKNTSEGMCMIANGYPFQRGDQIISFIHEYPANHYPWRLQEKRGVELILLPNRDITGIGFKNMPCSWSIADLEERLTNRTRVIAISHVQFTSGFAADLKQLGKLCKDHGIDLIVDAAQSLGCLPIYPEEYNISAIASSGWKWLLGPVGTGLLYTSPEFREKLNHVMVGAELMVQGTDYLNHSWNPHHTGKRFEYSTSPLSLAGALEVSIRDIHLRYGVENIRDEVFALQNIIINNLDPQLYTPLLFPSLNRSGILSLICKKVDPETIVKILIQNGIVSTSRAGLLRIAPHFYNDEDEINKAVSLLNSIMV